MRSTVEQSTYPSSAYVRVQAAIHAGDADARPPSGTRLGSRRPRVGVQVSVSFLYGRSAVGGSGSCGGGEVDFVASDPRVALVAELEQFLQRKPPARPGREVRMEALCPFVRRETQSLQ
jgi:hypothetical protein